MKPFISLILEDQEASPLPPEEELPCVNYFLVRSIYIVSFEPRPRLTLDPGVPRSRAWYFQETNFGLDLNNSNCKLNCYRSRGDWYKQRDYSFMFIVDLDRSYFSLYISETDSYLRAVCLLYTNSDVLVTCLQGSGFQSIRYIDDVYVTSSTSLGRRSPRSSVCQLSPSAGRVLRGDSPETSFDCQ